MYVGVWPLIIALTWLRCRKKMKVLRSDYEICEVSLFFVTTGKKCIPMNPFCRVVRTEVKYRLIGLVGCK